MERVVARTYLFIKSNRFPTSLSQLGVARNKMFIGWRCLVTGECVSVLERTVEIEPRQSSVSLICWHLVLSF